MAKRTKSEASGTSSSGKTMEKVESRVEAFAEDLGSLLGTAQAKAANWMGQRQEITKHLTDIRDTATRLLADLGHQAERIMTRGRPKKVEFEPPPTKRQKRKLSAKARKAISDAQKKRWAAVRAQKQ